VAAKDIGVITFYSQQVQVLRGMLEEGVQVATVDSFQGSEKPVILVSMVRTEGVGFVQDHCRLNVAITRAQHCLLIVGHQATLSKAGGVLGKLTSQLTSQGLVTSEQQVRSRLR
jgi:superfamily I DNA and/or RNA helicase